MTETAPNPNATVPYFPLHGQPGHRMDTRAGVGSLALVEPEKYRAQTDEKTAILASAPGYYFQCPAQQEPMAWEAVEMLLPNMAAHLPQHFALETRGERWTWTNRLRNTVETVTLGDADTLPFAPLDWIGRQIQEDLILMRQDGDEPAVCAAGHLCFAAGWCLDDKMGRPFLAIHAPVPGFADEIGDAADSLMRRLKAGRPVGRVNWSLAGSPHLNRAPHLTEQLRASEAGITPDNVPDRVYFRIERQTLTRLPRTGGILFTIHTYLNPLRDVLHNPEQTRLLTDALRAFSPDMIAYKGMTGYYAALIECLDIAF